jgi:hypothetical protein
VQTSTLRRKLLFLVYSMARMPLTLEDLEDCTTSSRLDLTAAFGHEISILRLAVNYEDLFERVDSDLK